MTFEYLLLGLFVVLAIFTIYNKRRINELTHNQRYLVVQSLKMNKPYYVKEIELTAIQWLHEVSPYRLTTSRIKATRYTYEQATEIAQELGMVVFDIQNNQYVTEHTEELEVETND